jgi:hypothetical protein
MTNKHTSGEPADNSIGRRHWRNLPIVVSLCLLALLVLAACAGKPASGGKLSSVERSAIIRQAAVQYVKDRDIAAAKATLARLELANPAQFIVTMAEQALNEGKPADEVAALARLADGLGGRSPKLLAYLAPTATAAPPPSPTHTPAPPSPPPAPTATPAPPTATSAPPTAAPTATPTAEPQKPRVVADSETNLRGGPGTNYPLVGKMPPGKEVAIIGRNTNGDWWRIAWEGSGQAWVAGLVVKVLGPIDTVAVAKDIPPPPPTFTPAPPPSPTAVPKPPVDFVVKSFRLVPLGQDAQQCNGGNHNIFVLVLDKNGAPLDGVRVREVWRQQTPETAHDAIKVTGAKGPGRVEYDIYRGGGGQVDIADEGGKRISELSRGMSADWPDFDLIQAAGYCGCKPYPDAAACRAGLEGKEYSHFPIGHYAFEVVFQRTW